MILRYLEGTGLTESRKEKKEDSRKKEKEEKRSHNSAVLFGNEN